MLVVFWEIGKGTLSSCSLSFISDSVWSIVTCLDAVFPWPVKKRKFREMRLDGPSLCMCITPHMKKVCQQPVCINPGVDWLESILTFVFSLGISWLEINTCICLKILYRFPCPGKFNDDLIELMRLFDHAGQHVRSAQLCSQCRLAHQC